MDQVTHGPLAVQQRPSRLRKAFLPYVYLCSFNIYPMGKHTIFHSFCSERSKEWTSLYPSLSHLQDRRGSGRTSVFLSKIWKCDWFSTTLDRIWSLTPSYSSVQVLGMNRFQQWVLHSLLFKAIHWNSHAQSISSHVARETKWGLVSHTVCVCALET